MSKHHLSYFHVLECGADHEADAVFVGGGKLVVVQTAYVLHMDEFEDVVDTQRQFHVGALGIDDVRALREVHEQRRAGILLEEGVVLVGELAPEDAEADILTPLEFLQQRNAIEELTIEVPANIT